MNPRANPFFTLIPLLLLAGCTSPGASSPAADASLRTTVVHVEGMT